MNIFNIFDDYEKKYHNWLQDKNVKSWYHPNQIVGAYQGSGIEKGLLSTRDTYGVKNHVIYLVNLLYINYQEHKDGLALQDKLLT